ncbi:kinesin light chain [Cladorrhinum sp. PSN332]|nr:kinesin light chain [Cladorrhinum sp. PSN332]
MPPQTTIGAPLVETSSLSSSRATLKETIDQLIQDATRSDTSTTADYKTLFVENVWSKVKQDYDRMLKELETFCKESLKRLDVRCEVYSRTKEDSSIEESFRRRQEALGPGQRFESLNQVLDEIHDLGGLRIVLTFPDDEGKATEFINKSFRTEREPTVFLRDRDMPGNLWETWFGAYQTCNHRLRWSRDTGSGELSEFFDVLFEIQVTTLAEDLYNKLAHPFLYKGKGKSSSAPLSPQDEMVIDIAHGNARCYALTLCYFKDRLNAARNTLPKSNGDPVPGLASNSGAKAVQDTTRFSKSLSELFSARGSVVDPESIPQKCSSTQSVEEWLRDRLEKANCPQSLRNRLNWEDAPFTVPYANNPSFVGRSEILDKLKVQLGHADGKDPKECTYQARAGLYGLGGVGKTQIALKYLFWLRETYPRVSIFWVHAGTRQRFREAYTSIARACKVPGVENPDVDVLTLVKEWLERRSGGRWLMVIDNADDVELFTPPESLGKYIPDSAHGSILVTTRNKAAGSRLVQGDPRALIQVGNMDGDDSRALLEQKLDRNIVNPQIISTLSSRLEYLPLALAQAAAFIQENVISVEEYLGLLDQSDQTLVDLLGEEFETTGRDAESSRAVAKTWILSFEQIERQNPLSGELLSLMSMFDRQAIPHEFMENYVANKQRNGQLSTGKVHYIKSLGLLKAFSFITEDQDHNYNMHRLVQLATRRWIEQKGEWQQFVERATLVVKEAYPVGLYADYRKAGRYLPHAYVVLDHAGTQSKAGKYCKAKLYHYVGALVEYQGNLVEAGRLLEHAVSLSKESWGENNLETLGAKGNLALNYSQRGRHAKAESIMVGVLSEMERKLPRTHKHVTTSMSHLASIYARQGQDHKAAPLEEELLKLKQKNQGEMDPGTLICRQNLASTYLSQGRLEKAEWYFEQTLAKQKVVRGQDHDDTLKTMAGLAQTYESQGRLKEAEVHFKAVLEGYKRELGEKHPKTLSSESELTSFYQIEARLEHDLSICEELNERRRTLGDHHPETLAHMYRAAGHLHNLGRYNESEEILQQCVRLQQQVLGPENQDTLESNAMLSVLLWRLGRHSDAIQKIQQALQGREKALGPDHAGTVWARQRLADWREIEKGKSGGTVETDEEEEDTVWEGSSDEEGRANLESVVPPRPLPHHFGFGGSQDPDDYVWQALPKIRVQDCEAGQRSRTPREEVDGHEHPTPPAPDTDNQAAGSQSRADGAAEQVELAGPSSKRGRLLIRAKTFLKEHSPWNESRSRSRR